MSTNSLFRIAGWAAMLLGVVLVAAVLVTFAPAGAPGTIVTVLRVLLIISSLLAMIVAILIGIASLVGAA